MITLVAVSRLIPMKGSYRIMKKHGQDISRRDGARLSFPVETSEPELESRAMKNKLIETTFRSGLGVAGHLLSRVACLGSVILICSSASAQNLFVSDGYSGIEHNLGNIYKFPPNGVPSTFASGLNGPWVLAFDRVGNLFVALGGTQIVKFTPAGTPKHLCFRIKWSWEA